MAGSAFLYQGKRQLDPALLERAQTGEILRPVLVGAGSRAAVETAMMAQEAGIAEAILVGRGDEYLELAQDLNFTPERFHFIEADQESTMIETACALVHQGRADCLIKGQIHTDVYMRGILDKQNGLRDPNGGRIVHVFAMIPPYSAEKNARPLLISDGAVNPVPDQKTLQQCVTSSIALAHALGIATPKLALLSATESEIASVPSSVQAAELVAWANRQGFDAQIAGPLALDGALAPEAVAIKGIDNPVAGCADIVIVPDIVSGNILFKSLVWFGGAFAAGVVLGARVPIVLTSRADPPEARLASIVLAKLMNQR